jgi:phosphatidylserine decarboxylase
MISRTGHYEPIAREGFVFIIPPAALSIVSWWLSYPWISLFFLLLSVCVALFFRNPERIPPEGEGTVLSPADGTVVELVDDARSDNVATYPLRRMSIFMSIFNTHVNRCPVSGTVVKITHVSGKFLDARESAASEINERNSIVLEDHAQLEVVQIAGKVARRIVCWVREGDQVRRGERFGLIRFGSRLDVYLPQNFTFTVGVGTKVRAGVTIIAKENQANE